MKKIVAAVLVLLLLIPAFAMAEGEFVFRDGITWRMNPAQVISFDFKGAGATKILNGRFIALPYPSVQVSKYTASLDYLFQDQLLGMILYKDFVADDQMAVLEYMKKALGSVYGVSAGCDADVILDYLHAAGLYQQADLTECTQFYHPNAHIWLFMIDGESVGLLYANPRMHIRLNTNGL